MRAREARLDDELLAPVLDETGSDSAMLDNAVELLTRSGRDVRHAMAMLLPPAWQNDSELDPGVRAFHRYHAGLIEPWDGPAGVVFTDGRVVGAALDRNGLRPLRYAITDDGLVACASEAGAIPLPHDARVRRGKLGPGQMLAVDAAGRGVELDGDVKRTLAARRPYLRWLTVGRRELAAGEPVLPPGSDLRPRHVLAGYTREDLSLVLRPAASTRPRADLLDGRRHRAATARRARAAALLVLTPALRAGDEPADRSPARAKRDVAADARGRACAAALGRPRRREARELESFFL